MRLETFFNRFDKLADAPDAMAKVRGLVFQLAIQGRLEPQIQTEEPATILLERIGAERAACTANRLSRDKTDTVEHKEESDPFPAPPGWTWTTLGNVQVFTNGYAFRSEDYQSSGVGIIRMGELGSNGEIDERNMKYVADATAQSLPDTFRVRPGDLLIGMSGSIGKLAINRSDKCYLLNQRVGRLEPILIEKSFLHMFLKTVEQHYLRISFGMAIKNLSTKQINDTPFPLPPLAEQRRIVAKVDELLALCDRLALQQQERETRHAALARASLARFTEAPTPANLSFLFHPAYTISPADLRKSILTLAAQGTLIPQDPNDEPASKFVHRLQGERKLAFDNLVGAARRDGNRLPKPPRNAFMPYANADVEGLPNGWCETRVGDVSDCLDYLRVPVNKSERLSVHGAVPYYGANGQVGWIDKHLFDEDLVLVVEDETFIGRVKPFSYVVRGKSWVNNHAHVLRPLGGIAADFLNIILCQYPFIPLTSGTTARRKLTQPSLMDAIFALPPLAEQHRIVAKVDQLMALVDQLEAQLTASRATATKLLDAIVAELAAA